MVVPGLRWPTSTCSSAASLTVLPFNCFTTSPTRRPALAPGESGSICVTRGPNIVGDFKELGILWRHVRDAHTHVAVLDFAVADQPVDCGFYDLRWNGKAGARKRPPREK